MAGNTFQLQTHINDELQIRLDAKLQAIKFANRKLEPLIRMKGTSVVVEVLPQATLSNITDLGADITKTQATATSATITISQAKGINQGVRDVEQIRAAFDLKGGMLDSIAAAFAQTRETHFLSVVEAGAGTSLTSTGALSASTVISELEKIAVAHGDNNVSGEVVCFVNPETHSFIRQSGIYVYTDSGMDQLAKGFVTRYAGMAIYESTLMPANRILSWEIGRPIFVEQMFALQVKDNPNAIGMNLVGEDYYQAAVVGEDANAVVELTYT